MSYVVTYLDVQPRSLEEALALINRYRNANCAEGPGVWTYALQERWRRNRFVTVEYWKDPTLMQSRETAEHLIQFRTGVKSIHNSPYDQRVHEAFVVATDAPDIWDDALYVVTHVDVPPPRREETEALLRDFVEHIRRDQSNLRFDVFQQLAPRTNHFTIFAAWPDETAFASYEVQPYTRHFREALGPMLGAPFDERLFRHVK